MALPAAGASVWAKGSQVWNGKSGVLIAKAINNPQNVSVAASPVMVGFATNCCMSNVLGSEKRYSAKNASSRNKLPTRV